MNMFRKIIGFLFLVICASQNIALAFKPTYETYGHTMITRSVLSPGGYSFGSGYTVPQFLVNGKSFSKDAIESIVLGVQSRDWTGADLWNCSGAVPNNVFGGNVACYMGKDGDYKDIVITGDIGDENAHFDNDNFTGSTAAIHKLIRSGPKWELNLYYSGFLFGLTPITHAGKSVTDLLKSYVKSVSPGSAPTLEQRQMLLVARIKLGKALHTLQDFYAHSTWADMYDRSQIFTEITDKLLPGVGPTPDFENFGSYTSVLAKGTSPENSSVGRWQGKDVCDSRSQIPPVTWLENGGNYAITSAAKQDRVISTSAWGLFALTKGAASDVTPIRCDHGMDTSHISGIAKDMPSMPFNPGCDPNCGNNTADSKDPHRIASFQAAQHSVELLNKLINIIQNDREISADQAQADRMVAALLGVDELAPRVALVVDGSASMSRIIPGISAAVDAASSVSGITVASYDASGAITTASDDKLAIRDLLSKAGKGGAGCEAPALTALLTVVNSLPNYSSVYLYVDAAASDASKLDEVVAAAVGRHIKINTVTMGGCGADTANNGENSIKAYQSLSQKTIGWENIGLPSATWVQGKTTTILAIEAMRNRVANAALQRASVPASSVQTISNVLLAETGTLSQPRTVQFPVDAGVTQMRVTVSALGAQANLTNPAGQAVALTDFGDGLTGAVVASPATGAWTMVVTGSAQTEYTAQVEVYGGVLLRDLQYESLVEVGDRSGHEYAPSLGRMPPSGRSVAKVQLDGASGSSITLKYVDALGNLIASYPLALVAPSVYQGTVTVPTSAYRVVVTGGGTNSTNFMRMWRGEHPLPTPPKTGLISVQAITNAWVQGQTGRASLILTNLGADETVTLSARSSVGTVQVTPNTVTLAASTKGSAELSVVIPASATVGASAGLVITMTGATGSREIEVPVTIQAAPAPTVSLTVVRSGTGSGTVLSSPSGINCGTACSAPFASGASVTLSATPATGSTFTGWSGECFGTGTCTVSMTATQSVTATFAQSVTAPVCTLTANPATITVGSSSTLKASCNQTVTSYTWTGGTCAGTTGDTCTVAPLATTTYTVAGTNAGGTSTADSKTVTVSTAQATSNLLVNPGFESGSVAWVEQSANLFFPPIDNTLGNYHSGSYSAYLGGYDNANDVLYQDVTIPANVQSAYVQFWYWIETQDAFAAFDVLSVDLYDPTTDTKLTTLTTLSNLDAEGAWKHSAQFDVSAYKGRTVRLRFSATTDEESPTSFNIDDVELATVGAAVSPGTYALSVSSSGAGYGNVASSPSGISCYVPQPGISYLVAPDCSESYASGTSVTLTATPVTGSSFTGWSGACSGTGTCTVSMTEAKSVMATFAQSVTAPTCTLNANPPSIASGGSSTLTAKCDPTATSYIWTGGTCAGTSGASCTVSPTVTTTYSVQGSNAGGTNQAASATVTVTAKTASYTVPGTLGNDVFVLTAGNSYYGGAGNDTFIVSHNTLLGGVTAKIIDTEGDNLIQLVDGMTVTASSFYSDAAQLTLSSGAIVQILGASKFKFQVGANALAGDTSAVLTYSEFVSNLGASLSGTLPASGTAGYVIPTGFTQASVPVPSVAGSSYTVPGTIGDDVLAPSGGNSYLGGGGKDVYIISPYTLSGAVTAKIIDTEGGNVIQLVGGLTIAASTFYSNAVQFMLSNGALVQILGASGFSYQLGANAPAGVTASSLSYAQFAAALGASVPTGASAVSGSANFVVQSSGQ